MTSFLSKTGRGSSTFLAAVGLALIGAALVNPAEANAAPVSKAGALTIAEANRSLDSLAKSLATANRSDLRSTIHKAVAKRFDGDEEALWSSLAADPAFSAKVAGSKKSSSAISTAAAKMPRLQVAVPVHFDAWDPATYAPLVAYTPQDIDDTQLTTITAYDAAGTAVTLDARVEPKQPVIVLGLNERSNDQGVLKEPWAASSRTTKSAQSSRVTTAAAAAKYSVDIRVVHLIEDKEPWTAGDAEISMRAKSRGCSGVDFEDSNWTNLNNNDDWWAPGGTRNLGSTTCDVVFAWWEDDGGAFDYTLSYGSFSLGVKMDNGDDMIGKKQLLHSSFKGGGTDDWQEDEWSALHQWTE
jgi:hypothetical protein